MMGVFRPNSLGRLTRRSRGTSRASISVDFATIPTPLSLEFSSRAQTEVNVSSIPEISLHDEPIYLPTHELLSLSPAFLSLYEMYESDFDETWRDTLKLLHRPALRGARETEASEVMQPFTDLLSSRVFLGDEGKFVLRQPGIGNLEAPLLAEGHRKLAMIMQLIANGVLLKSGYLFWDEPEANLNPASQKAIAHALLKLAEGGTQVFVATHSMFLLRELQMIQNGEEATYLGLYRAQGAEGDSLNTEVKIDTAYDIDGLSHVVALEAETEQAERYLSW